jgi:signal transduction histidine kinase/CheY-like chemotaxis protein
MQAADTLQGALRHAPVGLLGFGDDGTLVYANAQLSAWLGQDAQALVGRPLERLLTTASRVFYQTHVFPLLKLHGRADEIHLALRTADGSELPVMLSALRATAEQPVVSHAALMLIPRRREFEAALVEARRQAELAASARDEFLAVVSHELRTPLNAILGWARIGQSGKLSAELLPRAFDTIERSARAQSTLIEDLLDISRIVSGKLRLSPRAIDLAPVVDSAADTARPAAQAKDIELQLLLDPACGVVYADPDRMQQVVWNLLSNAIKFTPKGGRVQLRLFRHGSHVRIEVRDTGAGLSPEQLPYLFERFWQADPNTQREKTGLGLGLSICKSLIELHGGSIRADSAGLGQGAVFAVDLPLAVAAPVAQAGDAGGAGGPMPVGQPVLQGRSVLVVDDDLDARDLMRVLLAGAGAEVLTVEHCQGALAALRERRYDLLISDIGLPGEDGYALIRQVRAAAWPGARTLPAIAITGLSRPQDRVSLLRAGFQAYLPKPVDPAEAVALAATLTAR